MSTIHSRITKADEKVESFHFPCLRQHIKTGIVYLFHSIDSGTMVSGVAIGSVFGSLEQQYFKNFIGTVHITGE